MREFVKNIRLMIGEETSNGFFTPVVTVNEAGQEVTLQVPNFTAGEQEDLYPKIVLNAWISFVPIAEDEEELDTSKFKTTTHEARIQIDVFTKSEIQAIDISNAVVARFEEFFDDIEFIFWEDPYGWEPYNAIQRNPNYDTERTITKYGEYTLVDSIAEVETTPKSWFLDDTGLYVNGLRSQTFEERINGTTFVDGDTAAEKGFIFRNKSLPMRALGGDEDDTIHFAIEYDLYYNISRELAVGQPVDEIVIQSQEVD